MRWQQRPERNSALPDDLNPVVRRVLAARGVSDHSQLNYGLRKMLRPDGLKGITEAGMRIAQAVQDGQGICIVGDYDADGATATALCVLALRAFGADKISYTVPDRITMGYGLSPALVASIEGTPSLLITVDNGIVSTAGVQAANARGMDVVVTDHHLPAPALPAAAAIVNPNQHGCSFPSKALCGVGVAFYVMAQVRQMLEHRHWDGWADGAPPRMDQWLDLVALGTVADVVPLDHNNRILISQGIGRIRAGRARPGLLNLLAVAKRDYSKTTAQDLGFAAGPRLNAAGRLDDMRRGIECLIEDDPDRARALATQLDTLNRERRGVQEQMQHDALALLDQLKTPQEAAAHVLFDDSWHEGVVGLVASKIKERTHRPTIACAPAGEAGMVKASGRSVPGFHLRDALAEVDAANPGLIAKFGGHAMAAGLSLRKADLDRFSRAFQAVSDARLTAEQREQIMLTDGALKDAEQTLETALALEAAGPWGQCFEAPLFEGAFELINPRTVGSKHVKTELRSDSGGQLDAIAFFQDLPENSRMRVAYRLEPNEYNGFVRVQAVVEAWEPV